MKCVEILLFSLVLLPSCSTRYEGATVTPADVREAIRYSGVDPSETGMTASLADSKLLVMFNGRELVSVSIPEDWMGVVLFTSQHSHEGVTYHWAKTRWRTASGKQVRLNVKYFGEDSLFITLDELEHRVDPGASYSIEELMVVAF